jgi:hypothetical protein
MRLAVCLFGLFLPGVALANLPVPMVALPAAPSPGQQCRAAIAAAERAAGIPRQLMAAIARVESGRHDPATGRTDPWPWAINAEGEPGVFPSKPAAIASVRARQEAGVASIDVGCMQVNLLHHPRAFASLDQSFDPMANASYAARFLSQLYAETKDWTAATARYHSATPERGAAYQRKVAAIWPEELAQAGPEASPGVSSGASPGAIAAPRADGFLPPGKADNARIIPLAANAAPGRGLDAYRAAPIIVASRPRS